jgi:hypothetical protein
MSAQFFKKFDGCFRRRNGCIVKFKVRLPEGFMNDIDTLIVESSKSGGVCSLVCTLIIVQTKHYGSVFIRAQFIGINFAKESYADLLGGAKNCTCFSFLELLDRVDAEFEHKKSSGCKAGPKQ